MPDVPPTPVPDAVRKASGWRRHVLGLLGLGMVIAGGIMWTFPRHSATSISVTAFCLRVGMLLSALWLALPQLAAILVRYPPWLIIGSLVGLAVVILQPKAIFYLIPMAAILLAFHYFGIFARAFRSTSGPRSRPRGEPPSVRDEPR